MVCASVSGTTRSPNDIEAENHASSERVGCVRHNQILEFVHTAYFGLAKVIHGRDSKKRCGQLGKVTAHGCPENAASACTTVIALH